MSSAHGPKILSGSANKKPHGTFGRLLHAHEKRHFVLRLGAGSVPELAYYEGDAADDKHQKGVLYLDHPGVSITIHKDNNELQISNASKGSHHGFHHVVQDLMMEFSSLAELEKWNTALTKCLHPQPQVKHGDMVAASNLCMRAWEMGNEAEYRAVTTPNFRMVCQCPDWPCVAAGLRSRLAACAWLSPVTIIGCNQLFLSAGHPCVWHGRHRLRQRVGHSQEHE